MAAPSLNSPNIVREEYRGWTLHCRWFPSFAFSAEGWLCYPLEPGAARPLTGGVRLGRYPGADIALQHGRQYVDRKEDAPAQPAAPARRPPGGHQRA